MGDFFAVEHDWVKTYTIIPHKTISGNWVWLEKCYIRRVWRGGFTPEPYTEYGTIFDVLNDKYEHVNIKIN